MILKHHSDSILKILRDNNFKLAYNIKCVSFLNEDISLVGISNLRFNGNEVLIGISRKLIDYIYTLSRIITEEISLKRDRDGAIKIRFDKNKINEEVIKNKNLNDKFIDLLQKCFIGRVKNIDKIIYRKDKAIELSELFWDNAELFIISHEYAHACYKHIEKEKKNLNIDLQRKEEKEADNLALQIVLAHNMKSRGTVIPAYLGIGILFGSIEIINDIKGKGEAYATPKERLDILGSFIKRQYDSQISESWMLAEYMYEFIKCLWNNNRDLYNGLELYFKK